MIKNKTSSSPSGDENGKNIPFHFVRRGYAYSIIISINFPHHRLSKRTVMIKNKASSSPSGDENGKNIPFHFVRRGWGQ
jgi:hypothetical protein